MRKLWLGIVFFAASPAVFGQLDDNTLTITASRTIDLQPDQVMVGVYVNAPVDNMVDDILSGLQGSGLTAANLLNVSTSVYKGAPSTDWAFALPVPFSKLKATLVLLMELQQKLSGPRGDGKASMDVSFSVQGSQVSPELQASQPCPWTTLVGDARAQAQKLAAVAGVTVGPVIAISDGNGVSPNSVVLSQFAYYSGSLLPVARIAPIDRSGFFYSGLLAGPAPACSMTVQFKLLR